MRFRIRIRDLPEVVGIICFTVVNLCNKFQLCNIIVLFRLDMSIFNEEIPMANCNWDSLYRLCSINLWTLLQPVVWGFIQLWEVSFHHSEVTISHSQQLYCSFNKLNIYTQQSVAHSFIYYLRGDRNYFICFLYNEGVYTMFNWYWGFPCYSFQLHRLRSAWGLFNIMLSSWNMEWNIDKVVHIERCETQ